MASLVEPACGNLQFVETCDREGHGRREQANPDAHSHI
jgi:hypothetical protein